AATDVQLLKLIASAAPQTVLRHVADKRALAARILGTIQLLPGKALEIVQLLLKDPFDPAAVAQALVGGSLEFLDRLLDPNDWEFVKQHLEGLVVVPLAVRGGKQDPKRRGWRNGTRELLLETQQNCPPPGKLDIWMNVLVTRVLLEPDGADLKAVGLAYVQG